MSKELSLFTIIKNKEKLRKGEFPAYHLLNNPDKPTFPNDLFVVDFHEILSIPFEYLKKFMKKRKRRLSLISPYKEHLSQAFARYFMRVGLPSDIPPFK
jgi:hypothetical protein